MGVPGARGLGPGRKGGRPLRRSAPAGHRDIGVCVLMLHPALVAPAVPLERTLPLYRNALRNPKFSRTLAEAIQEAGAADGTVKSKGNLIYTVATKVGLPGRAAAGRRRLPCMPAGTPC